MKKVCVLDILNNIKNNRRQLEHIKNKKGISLAVLIITIIVIIILASVTIVSTKDSIDNANISSLASDLKEVEDATESYYLNNNQMPTPDGNTDSATKDQVLTISGSNNSSDLSAEFTLNGDDNNSEFYPIDLNKINVTNASRGTKKNGDNDVFYVAYPSMDVYYLKGVSAKGQKFFSLSSKISKYTKIGTNSAIDTSTTEVLSSNGLEITKEKNWTNTMPLTIKTNIASDETLYISISSNTAKQIDAAQGQYNKSFALTDLFTTNSILKDSATFSSNDIAADKKYLEVIKKKNDVTIATIKVDLSKFDSTAPAVSNVSTATYTNMNTVMFDIADDLSGVSSIRYDYLTKIDSNGTEQPYYSNVTSFDVSYMKTKAKRAKLVKNQGTIILNLPKNVNQVSYLIQDNAGNYILQGTRVSPIIYVSNIINTLSSTGFSITSNIYSTNGVSNVKYSYSTDGTTFSNEQSFDLNTSNVTTTQTVTFAGTGLTQPFLKTIVTDNNATVANRKADTSIAAVKLKSQSGGSNDDNTTTSTYSVNPPELATGMIPIKWDSSGNVVTTTKDDKDWYDYSNKKWANAETADGSMWVWIPRYEYQITSGYHMAMENGGTIDVKFISGTQTTADTNYIMHPAFTFGTTELKGIWVAKFEATAREGVGNSADSDNVITKHVKVIPNASSWRYINISNMFDVCRNMETDTSYGWSTNVNSGNDYVGNGINSHLMKNIEWGVVAYLAQSTYGKNSEVWINPNSNCTTGQAGTSVSASSTTSTYAYNNIIYGVNASTTGNVYGIYDMSGCATNTLAAYLNNGNSNLITYGNDLINANIMYKDVYDVGSSGDTSQNNYSANYTKKGDAVYETSSSGDNGSYSWYNDHSVMLNTVAPFFRRGGYIVDGAEAGIFNFSYSSGKADYYLGFRPVITLSNLL